MSFGISFRECISSFYMIFFSKIDSIPTRFPGSVPSWFETEEKGHISYEQLHCSCYCVELCRGRFVRYWIYQLICAVEQVLARKIVELLAR